VLRYCALASLATVIAIAQSSALPAHIKLADRELGAEFLSHSLPTAHGMILADDYLVVDVEAFPSAGKTISVRSGHFTLRLNHGRPLPADAPGMVAMTLRGGPDWLQPQGQRRPADPNAASAAPPATIQEVIARAALPEGDFKEHVRGCLFFPFGGKLNKLRSVELLIETEPGKDPVTLVLR
jgi:hypothetical protein